MNFDFIAGAIGMSLGSIVTKGFDYFFSRKRSKTENVKADVDLVHTSVNDMLQSVNALTEQNNKLLEAIIPLKKQNNDVMLALQQAQQDNKNLEEKIAHLEKRILCLQHANERLLSAIKKANIPSINEIVKEIQNEASN